MTPKKRMMAALVGDVPDRVPVFLRDLTLGLDVAGLGTPEVCAGEFDANLSARSVIAAQQELGHDAVVGSIQYCGIEVEMLGGEVVFPSHGIPSVTRAPLDSLEKIDFIQIPDARRDAPLSNIIKAYELVNRRIGNEVAVVGNVEGPITKAGILRGLDILAMDMVSDPDVFSRIIRLSNELTIDLCTAMCEAGAKIMFVAAATDNPNLFGSEIYRKYTLPGLDQIVDIMRKEGVPTAFHPHGIFSHGEFSNLVDATLDTGISGFQFAEDNDLAKAKEHWGNKTCIMGGVNAFTTLLLGPPQAIREETIRCLDACKDGGGYVFMCSCSLHRGMPLSNVKELVKTVASRGSYNADFRRDPPPNKQKGDWVTCSHCGHKYQLIAGRGLACYGCPSAINNCGMTRCPKCDSKQSIEKCTSEHLSSLLRRHRSQYGRTSFR
ncbi:MAG: hypothetical protein GX369_03345 [Euryarchaeota archaeon]|nr:hypothetical protein [Euryarchaeota archaeon]